MPEVRVSEKFPMPATVDEVAEAVRKILSLGGVEHLSLNLGEEIYVERRKDVRDTTLPDDPAFAEFTLEDMITRVELGEYAPQNDSLSPQAQLFEMMVLVGTGGFVVTHVLCYDKRNLRRWLGMEGVLPDDYRLLNANVVESRMLPPEIVMVFGGYRSGVAPSDVKIALKLTVGASHVREEPSHHPAPPERDHPGGHSPFPAEEGDAPEGDGAPPWFGPYG
jgi:hypothetical protein